MNVVSRKPLTLAEAKELIKDLEEKQVLHDYFKTFTTLSAHDAKECVQKLHALNSQKLNDAHIVKLVDVLPKDIEDVNKVCNDLSLTEEEASAVLAITTKF